MKKQAKLSGPTPKHILKAIDDIARYLQDGNWEQAIINRNGGVVFKLTDIYREVLGDEVVDAITGGES